MDTSEQYIKMCDCNEIQGQWKEDTGDYYVLDGGIKLACHQDFKIVLATKNICIWLPRQDQIQEMMGNLSKDKDGYSELLHDFNQFIEFENTKYAETFEQLWLAFYMNEKHRKTWDGKKWITK